MNYWTKKFIELNNKYWDGKLTNIQVDVLDLSHKGAEGILYHSEHGDEYCEPSIEIETSLPHHHKINILLHEMCHLAVYEFYDYEPYHHHGKEWKKEMIRCGFKGKLHARRGLYKTKNL